jgi:hypothetical protein
VLHRYSGDYTKLLISGLSGALFDGMWRSQYPTSVAIPEVSGAGKFWEVDSGAASGTEKSRLSSIEPIFDKGFHMVRPRD